MAYIGKTPQVGNYVKLDAITCSSTNTYNLTQDSVAFTPESALHMMVSLNGVIQAPLSSFSVSGSTITFLPSSGTLSSSDTIDFILVLGNVLDIGTPSDSTVTNAKTNFVSTSSASGLQIKGDNTTAGTLQLNCEQNSHGIKLRSPAHTHNQSYTLTFPTTAPVADKALITDGSGNLSFGTVGGLVKLASTTVSSSVALVAFDSSIITSTYDTYYFTVQGVVPTSDDFDLKALTSVDNGSNFVTHETSLSYFQMNGTDTGRYYARGHISITEDEDNGTDHGINGQIILFNVNNTASDKHAVSDGLATNANGGSRYSYTGRTLINTASALNYIKFYGNNNIVAGTFTVYGLVK